MSTESRAPASLEIEGAILVADGDRAAPRPFHGTIQFAAPAEEKTSKTYIVNVTLVAVFGVLLSVWLALYSEYLTALATALGLGGIFIWLGSLLKLVADKRKKQLQALFERNILEKRITSFAVGFLFLVFLSFAATHGTLILGSHDSESYAVTIYDQDGTVVETAFVRPGAFIRCMVWAPLWGGHRYRIRALSLPAIEQTVTPIPRRTVWLPSSFMSRPLVLLRGTDALAGLATSGQLSLEVTLKRRGKELRHIRLDPFDAPAYWIGNGPDVPVPDFLKKKLTSEVWLPPRAIFSDVVLRNEDEITAKLCSKISPPPPCEDFSLVVKNGGLAAAEAQEIVLGW